MPFSLIPSADIESQSFTINGVCYNDLMDTPLMHDMQCTHLSMSSPSITTRVLLRGNNYDFWPWFEFCLVSIKLQVDIDFYSSIAYIVLRLWQDVISRSKTLSPYLAIIWFLLIIYSDYTFVKFPTLQVFYVFHKTSTKSSWSNLITLFPSSSH